MSDGVSYSRDMRTFAKQERLELVTIALPGMVWQSPVSSEDVAELHKLFRTFLNERSKRRREQA
jgi:hypothetical protein